jgi:hypothetical protein
MAVTVALLAAATYWRSSSPAAAQAASDLDQLVGRIGQRVAEYYRRAQTVMCLERSTVQPMRPDWSLDGMGRTVESDLRVELNAIDAPGEPSVVREIRRINARTPSERDTKSRSGCTDPNPLSPEPLAFLLPSHRGEYRFTSVKNDKEHGRAVLVVAFQTTERKSRPELIEDERGHDDCFDWKGPVARSGKLWVDAETHDVLKLETRLEGPVEIRVSSRLQRRYHMSPWIVLERDDVTLKYKTVQFSDPDEVLLLPDSIESMTVLRSDLQSVRRTDLFRDYRRFLTSGRITKGTG